MTNRAIGMLAADRRAKAKAGFGELAGEKFTPRGARNAKPGKRAALYMRVSTEEQTTANQRPELLRLAKSRGLSVVAEYVEKQSAVKVRPVYERMMREAHDGAFDVLLVWAIDRFGRSMIGNLQAVAALDKRGIEVVSARESWLEMDRSNPVRPLIIMIFSWVAEQERNRLSERTKAGMERARASGKAIGRPRAHVPLANVNAMLESGVSKRQTAKLLGVSPGSMARALARAPSVPKGVSRRRRSK